MPDDTPSVNNTTQDLTALGDQANAVSDIMARFFSKVSDGAKKSNVDVSSIGSTFDTLNDKIKDMAASLNVAGSSANFNTLQNPLDKLIGSFVKLEQVVDQSKVFQQFSVDSGSAINSVNLNLNALQKSMTALHMPGAELIIKSVEGLIANGNEAEKLETAFVALSAAGGDLDKIFTSQGGQLKDLSSLTAAYTNAVANAADATGLSVHQSMEFGNALKTIPGFMDELVSVNIEGQAATTSLIESMRLMTGTGRSQSDVIKAMSLAYDDLSTSQGKITDGAQKGAEFFATMSSVSTGLKLKFDDVRNVMESIADQFKFVGNETDAAAKILGRYTDALRETGLTSKASVDVISQMVKGISDLGMGTKAFLSIRSGGPGGLQGAFQVEQLLRNGKLDEVVQMAEKSIKQQFGGKIYTQAEAAQSPQAASQFMRQRSLLKSGAFGIGKDMSDEQSTRLLEALGKGDTLAATKEIKTGQDALTAVSKQGMDIQERNNNELKTATRFLERNAIASELMAGATIRNAFGTSGNDTPNKNTIQDRMRRAGTQGAIRQSDQQKQLEKGSPTLNDFTQQLIILGRNAINNVVDAGKGAVKGGAEVGKEEGSAVKLALNAIKQLHSEVKEQTATVNAPDVHRRNEVLKKSVSETRQHTPTALNVANTATRNKQKQDEQHQQLNQKNTTPKVILEILGPPGFELKQKNTNENLTINMINSQSTVPKI